MDRDFSSVEDIFPKLKSARSLIKELIDGTDGFLVTFDGHNINIAINFPTDVLGKIPTDYVLMIKDICYDLIRKRITNDLMNRWAILVITDRSIEMISNDIKDSEQIRISNGHPSLKEELSIKLGLFRDFYKLKWDLK